MKTIRRFFDFLNTQQIKWLVLLTTAPSLGLADTSTDHVTPILRGVIDLLTSGIARLIAVICIIGIGYAWMGTGRIPAKRAMSFIGGIATVFSAAWIAQKLGVAGA